MPERTPTERLRILEQKLEPLESLPDRVSAVERQIVQLRDEMHEGFFAIRQELRSEVNGLRGGLDDLRGEFRQLRGEVDDLRGEFRQLRGEFDDLRGEFRQLRGEFDDLRSEFRQLRVEFDDLRGDFRQLRAEYGELRNELLVEIRAGDEETRRYMRVLHEDLLARIAAIGNGARGSQ